MSPRKWSLREYRPEDFTGVQELFAVVFHQPRPPEHFVWKFNENPAGRGINTVAEDSGRIMGHCALMPMPLRIGNEAVRGAQGVDAMVHPDYRNQGLFVALYKACMDRAGAEGIEVLYAIPRHRSGTYNGCVHRLDWDHPGNIGAWVRVLNARSPTLSSFSHSVRIISLGLQFMPIGKSSPRGVDIRMERPKENEFLTLADQVASSWPAGACRIDHSADWFRWRFDSASQRHYLWFSAYRDGDLKGWAVFGVNDWGEMPVLDMSGIDAKALEAVTGMATRRAKELGLAMLLSFTNENNVARALRSCGFFRYGSMPLIVHSLTPRTLDGNIHLQSSWHMASEDLDAF